MLENAILLNRITRSSVVRNIQVEVGDMPKSKVQATLRHVKELFEQKSSINAGSSMSEYTNPGPIENNIRIHRDCPAAAKAVYSLNNLITRCSGYSGRKWQ